MKITGIETLVINAQMRNWIFVKVKTDQDGLWGWGEASLNWKTRSVVGAVEDLAPLLLNRDPRDIEQCVRIMKKHSYYKLGIIGMSALSGIEHALWDIFGRSVGLPVWRLIGGRTRDKVKLYTNIDRELLGGRSSGDDDEGRLCARAAEIVAAGYEALKLVILPHCHHTASIPAIRRVGRLMDAVRNTVGDSIDIMVDFRGRPSSASLALQFIEAIAPGKPLFCEEPIQPGDTRSLAMISQRAQCPIATGERLVGYGEFEDLLAERAVHILQPDLNHTGGLSEGRKIAAAGEAAMMGVAPHNPNGPLAGAAALHFDVATPNFIIQEEIADTVPWYFDVVTESPIRREGGYWLVPETPGLGVSVNEQEARKHPFLQDSIATTSAVMADGTIVDW